jgi:drug/metabolite transporter (DMT)-like permease
MTKNTFLLAAGFVLLWNSGFIGAEYGLPYAGPFTFLFWRYAALTLTIFVYLLSRRRLQWIGWRRTALDMLVGILAHGVWLGCVLFALDAEVPAGIIALVVALQPMATGAFSGLAVGEPTPLRRWAGLFVGFAGVAVTVVARIDFQDAASVFGYLIPLGSVIAITAASLVQRRMDVAEAEYRLPVDASLFYQALATTAAVAGPAVVLEGLKTQWTPAFISTTLWLSLGVSWGAYAFMWILLERVEATRVASLFYLGPPVTMLMAWAAFGDSLRATDLIGLLVVCMGVVLAQRSGPSKC